MDDDELVMAGLDEADEDDTTVLDEDVVDEAACEEDVLLGGVYGGGETPRIDAKTAPCAPWLGESL